MDTQSVFRTIITTIDGNVQSEGIKIRFPGWMVIGSSEWLESSDEIKAHAYQAAKKHGWSDESLVKSVVAVHQHIDRKMAEFTISELQEMSKSHPWRRCDEVR